MPLSDGQEGDFEPELAQFVSTARRLTRLARSLGNISTDLRDLQEAIALLQGSFARATVLPSSNHDIPSSLSNAYVVPPTEPASRSGEPLQQFDVNDVPRVDVAASVGVGPVTVTVIRQDGTLDLTRVYDALAGLPDASNLNLTKYERSRADVLLSIDRSLARVALPRALDSAFPGRVQGQWLSDIHYEAVIGPF